MRNGQEKDRTNIEVEGSVRSNVLNVGRHFEISTKMSRIVCGQHEIIYPISNVETRLMSLKFRQISDISADFVVLKCRLTFAFSIFLGVEPINPSPTSDPVVYIKEKRGF